MDDSMEKVFDATQGSDGMVMRFGTGSHVLTKEEIIDLVDADFEIVKIPKPKPSDELLEESLEALACSARESQLFAEESLLILDQVDKALDMMTMDGKNLRVLIDPLSVLRVASVEFKKMSQIRRAKVGLIRRDAVDLREVYMERRSEYLRDGADGE